MTCIVDVVDPGHVEEGRVVYAATTSDGDSLVVLQASGRSVVKAATGLFEGPFVGIFRSDVGLTLTSGGWSTWQEAGTRTLLGGLLNVGHELRRRALRDGRHP